MYSDSFLKGSWTAYFLFCTEVYLQCYQGIYIKKHNNLEVIDLLSEGNVPPPPLFIANK